MYFKPIGHGHEHIIIFINWTTYNLYKCHALQGIIKVYRFLLNRLHV